jgi:hypothetical protein
VKKSSKKGSKMMSMKLFMTSLSADKILDMSIQEAFLGSVSNAVVHKSKIRVLIVK